MGYRIIFCFRCFHLTALALLLLYYSLKIKPNNKEAIMLKLFVRITDVIAANINEMVDRVEDPERMIKQIIREMEENIRRAKDGVIDAISREKELYRELELHRRDSEKWHKKAESALRSGKEGLAREALLRKKEHDRILKDMEMAWEAANDTSEKLKSQFRALENKLEEAKRKRSALAARQHAAQARREMHKTTSYFERGLDIEDKFIRMEERVVEIENRTEAIAELDDDRSGLEREIDRLEIDAEVEDELEALRKKIDDKPSSGAIDTPSE